MPQDRKQRKARAQEEEFRQHYAKSNLALESCECDGDWVGGAAEMVAPVGELLHRDG